MPGLSTDRGLFVSVSLAMAAKSPVVAEVVSDFDERLEQLRALRDGRKLVTRERERLLPTKRLEFLTELLPVVRTVRSDRLDKRRQCRILNARRGRRCHPSPPRQATPTKRDEPGLWRSSRETVCSSWRIALIVPPFDIDIGRCVVAQDPWGNRLVMLDR